MYVVMSKLQLTVRAELQRYRYVSGLRYLERVLGAELCTLYIEKASKHCWFCVHCSASIMYSCWHNRPIRNGSNSSSATIVCSSHRHRYGDIVSIPILPIFMIQGLLVAMFFCFRNNEVSVVAPFVIAVCIYVDRWWKRYQILIPIWNWHSKFVPNSSVVDRRRHAAVMWLIWVARHWSHHHHHRLVIRHRRRLCSFSYSPFFLSRTDRLFK